MSQEKKPVVSIAKVEMTPLLLYLPRGMIEALDDLVRKGHYPNRNEAIRFAIHDLLQEERCHR